MSHELPYIHVSPPEKGIFARKIIHHTPSLEMCFLPIFAHLKYIRVLISPFTQRQCHSPRRDTVECTRIHSLPLLPSVFGPFVIRE